MPNKGAFADFTTGWHNLLTNVARNAAELPDLSVYVAAVAEVLEDVKARGAQQDSRKGLKRQESKDLRERMKVGRANAAKLRAALKAHYGYTSPRLLEYGIKPITPGKRQPKTPVPEGPKPENPAPTPPEVKPAPQGTGPSKSEGPAPQPDPSPQKS